ncbi:MAG TPA: hypothetical protein VKZ50_04530 [bacterium]|nr:hypothetical protein [bacterium]
MTTMMPPRAPVMLYRDENQMPLEEGVQEWFLSNQIPTPHGRIQVPGRRGEVYHVGRLVSELTTEWPPVVRNWLRQFGSSNPEALVIEWRSEKPQGVSRAG